MRVLLSILVTMMLAVVPDTTDAQCVAPGNVPVVDAKSGKTFQTCGAAVTNHRRCQTHNDKCKKWHDMYKDEKDNGVCVDALAAKCPVAEKKTSCKKKDKDTCETDAKIAMANSATCLAASKLSAECARLRKEFYLCAGDFSEAKGWGSLSSQADSMANKAIKEEGFSIRWTEIAKQNCDCAGDGRTLVETSEMLWANSEQALTHELARVDAALRDQQQHQHGHAHAHAHARERRLKNLLA